MSSSSYSPGSRSHPYVPSSLPAHGYVPNSIPSNQICYAVGAVIIGLFLFATVFARCLRLPGFAHNVFVWLLVAAPLELVMNGFLLYNRGTIHTLSSFPAQVWKEYALADSRYMSSKNKLVFISTILNAFVFAPYMLLQVLKMILYRKNVVSVFGCIIAISAAYLCNIVVTLYPALTMPKGLVQHYSAYDFQPLHFAAPHVAYVANVINSLTYLGSTFSRSLPVYIWGYLIGLHALRAFMPVVILLWAPRKIFNQLSAGRNGNNKSGQHGGASASAGANRSRNTYPAGNPEVQKKKIN